MRYSAGPVCAGTLLLVFRWKGFLPFLQTMSIKTMKGIFVEQLRTVINEYEEARSKSQYDDGSDVISKTEIMKLNTRCITVVERASGFNSTYSKEVRRISKETGYPHTNVVKEMGVVEALLSDIESGYVKTIEEEIHGDVFSDYLEMASHLVSQGYKDPAAVMAGSTLEVHLKKLCERNDIETVKSNGKPKTVDALNAELTKVGVYTKLDQKNVTAWLGLRNNAAHGEYDEYTKEQVRLLIDGVRDFITRYPA